MFVSLCYIKEQRLQSSDGAPGNSNVHHTLVNVQQITRRTDGVGGHISTQLRETHTLTYKQNNLLYL